MTLILYVEDSPDIREIVALTLTITGLFDVRTASSGAEAIELAAELQPDLVLMDVMMPGLDGPETLRRMRSSAATAAIPVIFVTGKALPEEVEQLVELGALGVIRKPFDPMTLGRELMFLWKGEDALAGIAAGATDIPEVRSHVDSLETSFLVRTQSEVDCLTRLIDAAEAGDASAFAEIEQMAHAIAGSATMFGFSAVSEAAGEVGRLIRARLKKAAPLGPLRNAAERLRKQVADAEHTERRGNSIFHR